MGGMMYNYFSSNWNIERFYYVSYGDVILYIRLFYCFFRCVFVRWSVFYSDFKIVIVNMFLLIEKKICVGLKIIWGSF